MTETGAAPHDRRRAGAAALAAALLFAFVPALLPGVPPAVAAPQRSDAAAVKEVTGFGTNPGLLRMFRYVPDGLPAGRPVVVVLHGCTQNAAGYGTGSGWTELADRWGFSLVLPQQQPVNNISSCFNWFQTTDTARGRGEAASVAQMVDRHLADLAGDPRRVYVTGLSAGGGMTSVMMAAYPERFAAGGVVAGLPYGCAQAAASPWVCMSSGGGLGPRQWGDRVRAARPGYGGPWPVLTVLHGTADPKVNAVNMTDLTEQWTDVHGADLTPDVTDTVAGHPHQVFRGPDGAPAVETYGITGMAHGQPVDPGTGGEQCGTAGANLLDVGLCAAYRLGRAWGLDT
ncbi:extracellular catalytic domain type 1 short-chain-length polyhydroxyalkanoate depolymerase [Streptomyces sp. AN091965]|uniref:extracellular catalytic domain type 1 short-chain-length polyhydroxyalkanoate depolymerase n=1 Tax=Streptomyces sp. AN091965 TaxID=2927803 RepID=UPI001F605B38|nr:PHB depolymerase family esterase [Streptomyces sp. AN091965]MCI3934313.1 PHB depolymerase family esterase [Streptomyces sp. AN091965]